MTAPSSTLSTTASGWTDTAVSVRLRRGIGGTVRVDGTLCSAPVWFRWDGATLWLVGSGASPVGEDHVRVRVEIGPGVDVAVRAVAATMVYAARGSGTRWDTEILVGAGARLDWSPEPVIVTARARHVATTTIHAATDAEVLIDDVLVLGRTDETSGSISSTLDVRVDGQRVLLTSNDTSTPGWSGPGGVDGADVVASRLRLAGHPEPAREPPHSTASGALLAPASGTQLAVVTASDVAAARAAVDELLPR